LRRFRLLVLSAVASVFAAFGVVAPAEAAVDYFLEVNGVPGESQDAKMAKAIDVLSYSWGASQNADKKSGPRLGDLVITHNVDLASPPLFQRLVTGTTIPSAELIARKAGENQFIFLRFCFENVQVTSIQQSGKTTDDVPTEQVSFGYAAVSEQYTQQSNTGGIGNTVFAGWNATQGALIQTYPASCGN
jgi:type VI secretion system secreted protein Hcp